MADKTPEQDEPKSERFNMFISKSEMDAIDEWAWANRIRSKSEAVRRLCQIGIGIESELEALVDHSENLMKAAKETWDQRMDEFRPFWPEPDSPEKSRAGELSHEAFDLFDRAERIYLIAVASYNRIVPLLDGKTYKEAVAGADEAKKASEKIFDKIRQQDAQYEENRRLAIITDGWSKEQKEAYDALSEEEKDAFLYAGIEKLRLKEEAEEDLKNKKDGK